VPKYLYIPVQKLVQVATVGILYKQVGVMLLQVPLPRQNSTSYKKNSFKNKTFRMPYLEYSKKKNDYPLQLHHAAGCANAQL